LKQQIRTTPAVDAFLLKTDVHLLASLLRDLLASPEH